MALVRACACPFVCVRMCVFIVRVVCFRGFLVRAFARLMSFGMLVWQPDGRALFCVCMCNVCIYFYK